MKQDVASAGGVEGACAESGAQASAENGKTGQEVGLTAEATQPYLSDPIAEFVRRFDAGKYPRLVER